MLRRLDVSGLAIIDALAIDFTPGFNVITGETGAGKSILIKALSLLLGAKANADTVRSGRESASVTGIFEVPRGHKALKVMEAYSIPYELDADGSAMLIRRTLTNKGRSLAWVNDVAVTVHTLRELAQTLIDIFGQHENQRLLDVGQHTAYLDQFLKDRSVWSQFRDAARRVHELMQNLTGTVDELRAKSRDADYLRFRADELQQFRPEREDFEHVQSLCRSAQKQLSWAQACQTAQALLDQGAGGEPLSTPLREAHKVLARIGGLGPEVQILSDEAAQLAAKLDELSYEIGRMSAALDIDEARLEDAQARLARYQELLRKFGVLTLDELLAEEARLAQELAFLNSGAEAVQEYLQAMLAELKNLEKQAATLSAARQAARLVVKQRVERELSDLAMPGARLEVELTPAQRSIPDLGLALFGEAYESSWQAAVPVLAGIGDAGAERAQFLLATNPGEPAHPLHRVASGGEVSRVMLALKKGLADGADTCILVFDEIDTGISGRVADMVGRKMQGLASNFQVICISHLAQVAAYAESHFLVSKAKKGERTETSITRLSDGQSAEEIARLLSGDEVTTSSLANARALIAKAKEKQSRSGAKASPVPKVAGARSKVAPSKSKPGTRSASARR